MASSAAYRDPTNEIVKKVTRGSMAKLAKASSDSAVDTAVVVAAAAAVSSRGSKLRAREKKIDSVPFAAVAGAVDHEESAVKENCKEICDDVASKEVKFDPDDDDVADDEVKAIMADQKEEAASYQDSQGDESEEEIDDAEEFCEITEKSIENKDSIDLASCERQENEKVKSESEDESEDDELGDSNREPGADATRTVDPAHLMPFRVGWRREVVVRPATKEAATQYQIFYLPPEDGSHRTREARRKRCSKSDQEKYFEDFPSKTLNISNFTYVGRPLGLNNAAYEIIRKCRDPAPGEEPGAIAPERNAAAAAGARTGRGAKQQPQQNGSARSSILNGRSAHAGRVVGGRLIPNYKEVDESTGLLDDDSDGDGDSDVFKDGFDLRASVSLQAAHHIPALRDEHRRRRKFRNPETCCTPPLAEDMLWTDLDDDPLGVFTAMGGRSSPTTPPPLRALKLTPESTAEKIANALHSVKERASCAQLLKEPDLNDNMASHDSAITKFKSYVKAAAVAPGAAHSDRLKHLTAAAAAWAASGRPLAERPPSLSMLQGPLKTCTRLCPQASGKMPSMQCMMCKALFHPRCQGIANNVRFFRCRPCQLKQQQQQQPHLSAPRLPAAANNLNQVAVKLPMQPINGKRPIVELVVLQNNKYQPIKFSNNMRVTESIPKSMFDQANALRKTIYLKATQIPNVAGKQLFLAINPSGGAAPNRIIPSSSQVSQGVTVTSMQRTPQNLVQKPGLPHSDQVAILVRPAKMPSATPVLLNVPRHVAVKVKPGTTLSFSSSNDQKYTVIDSKIHPAVRSGVAGGSGFARSPAPVSFPNGPRGVPLGSKLAAVNRAPAHLTKSVTIHSVSSLSFSRRQGHPATTTAPRRGPSLPAATTRVLPAASSSSSLAATAAAIASARVGAKRAAFQVPPTLAKRPRALQHASPPAMAAACTPYCPGVSGFPDLECQSCHTLFHSKCAGIAPNAVSRVKAAFKCKNCSTRVPG